MTMIAPLNGLRCACVSAGHCRCLVEEAQRILRAYERTAKPKFGTLRSLICPGVEAQQVSNHLYYMLVSHLPADARASPSRGRPTARRRINCEKAWPMPKRTDSPEDVYSTLSPAADKQTCMHRSGRGWRKASAGASSMRPSTGLACSGLWSSMIAAMTQWPERPSMRFARSTPSRSVITCIA